MIFGFNTDVTHAGTVYHVQSEARKHDRIFQSQIFVGGRCVGKYATSYMDEDVEPAESDPQELLREQHRMVVEAVRAGELERLLTQQDQVGISSDGFALEWLNQEAACSEGTILLRLRVTDSGSGVAGAEVTTRCDIEGASPVYVQALTDASGAAEMRLSAVEPTASDAALLLQATHEGRVATCKFRLRRP
jgi:hypothetical protein